MMGPQSAAFGGCFSGADGQDRGLTRHSFTGAPCSTTGPGGFHGFDMMAPHSVLAKAARAARDSWVARTLGV